jgi:hypothetical protein
MFINVGRFYNITQLVMNIDRSKRVDFRFRAGRSSTNAFDFTPEKARQIIKLFQVQSLKISCRSSDGHEFDEYWRLIDCIEGWFLRITI